MPVQQHHYLKRRQCTATLRSRLRGEIYQAPLWRSPNLDVYGSSAVHGHAEIRSTRSKCRVSWNAGVNTGVNCLIIHLFTADQLDASAPPSRAMGAWLNFIRCARACLLGQLGVVPGSAAWGLHRHR